MIKVSVPATTANIGVGFDIAGLALSWRGEVTFAAGRPGYGLQISGCPAKYCTPNNLVYRAFVMAAEHLNRPVPADLALVINVDVPPARGLGSSAVCIVAGIAGANAFFAGAMTRREIVNLATRMEGHPDNVAPAVMGRLCITAVDATNGATHTVNFDVSPVLKFLALVPDFEVSTEAARAVLPLRLDYATAVHQMSRCALLPQALMSGDMDLIKLIVDDRMHQRQRAALIAEFGKIQDLCHREDVPLFISGSGSTMLVISDDQAVVDRVALQVSVNYPGWLVRNLVPDTAGVVVSTQVDGAVAPVISRRVEV